MSMDAVRFIRSHNDFILIAHVSPDGDTLGSCFALCGGLELLGKSVQIVCAEPVPAIYRFLPFSERVLSPDRAKPAEAVVCVDCADIRRTDSAEPLFHAAKSTLNIDHHGTNDRYADVNFVRIAGATGELAYNLLTALKVALSIDIASCLYTAITTDTGNFSYSNTTPDTLRIAAELLDLGIDLPYLNRCLFRTVPYHKMRLHALAVTKSELHAAGQIGISTLTLDDFRSCGATGEDSEGIIDSIRDIDTVELAAFLRESEDGSIRVSLRGKSRADVSRIALLHGGGGHRFAAGCTLHCPMTEAKAIILHEALAQLDQADA